MSRTILITGASSDIGLGLVRALAEDADAHLVCHYHRNAASLEGIVASARARISAEPADFSRTDEISRWVEAVRELAPCPDVLVFLASPPLRLVRMKDTPIDEYDRHLRVQILSAAETLRACLPSMVAAKRGTVVFLLSTVATGATPGSMAPYVTAKYGLRGLFHATCAECKGRNVRVHAVAPGLVRTKFLSDFPARLLELEAERAESGRLLEVADVVSVLLRCVNDPELTPGEIHAV